jgi:hypothetical protein
MGRGKDPYYHIVQKASQEAKARGLSNSQRAVVARAAREAAERAASEAAVRAIAAEIPRGVQRAVAAPRPIASSTAGPSRGFQRAVVVPRPIAAVPAARPPALLVANTTAKADTFGKPKSYYWPRGPPSTAAKSLPAAPVKGPPAAPVKRIPVPHPVNPPSKSNPKVYLAPRQRSRSRSRQSVRSSEEEGEFVEEL